MKRTMRPASVANVGMAPIPFDKMTPGEQLSEIFYKHAVEVTKPAYHAINRAYPAEDRRDAKIESRFQEAHRQAKQHLNFYKKGVRDFVETFVIAKRHPKPYDAEGDIPTNQLRNFLRNQLSALHKRLSEYAPILVPENDVASFKEVLNARFAGEIEALMGDLACYEADAKEPQYANG